MIHGGHGHLISQFVSPYSNKRTDRYGGNLENRARFAIEVLTAIRKKVGNKLALEYRISANELVPGGMEEEQTIEFVKMIEDKIDLLHVSAGLLGAAGGIDININARILIADGSVSSGQKAGQGRQSFRRA